MLIGIDGINGCGKSTLIDRLKIDFPNAVFCREPGETELGSEIRNILLNRNYDIDAFSEFLLFATDHNENWQKVVKPALYSGKHVFTDRSYVSSLAFQGALGASETYIQYVINMIAPPDYDLFIILDCDLDVAEKRMGNRGRDVLESRSREYMRNVQKYFKDFCFIPGETHRRYIDTTELNPDQVYEVVKEVITGHPKYAQK